MKRKSPSAILPRSRDVLAPANLPYQMFLLVQQMTKRFQEILTPHGITPLHWGILCCLWQEDGLRTTEIATRLEQLGGTVTIGLDTMERDGLIRRKKDAADGRISRIFLTERGGGLQIPLERAAAALLDDMFMGMSPAEHRSLSEQVARLRRMLLEGTGRSSASPEIDAGGSQRRAAKRNLPP